MNTGVVNCQRIVLHTGRDPVVEVDEHIRGRKAENEEDDGLCEDLMVDGRKRMEDGSLTDILTPCRRSMIEVSLVMVG